MDAFDYNERTEPSRNVSAMIWNVLTVLVLLVVLCIAIGFLVIFVNPNTGFNPFPPPTLPAALSFPTATPTSQWALPPTWTPSPTVEPTMTFTPEPSSTPLPSETPFSLFTASPTVALPTSGTTPGAPTATVSDTGGMPFVVGPGTPVGTSSLTFHPEAGCNWLGVAGQVFDLSGAPVSGQQVRIGGILAGVPVDGLTLTGLTTAYGTVGFYEFPMGDKPVASQQTVWVQLIDQGGLPMSDKILFDTYDNCDKNLIFVNFKQVR